MAKQEEEPENKVNICHVCFFFAVFSYIYVVVFQRCMLIFFEVVNLLIKEI